MLLFLSADDDDVGLDLPVGVDRYPAVTPFAADLNVFVKLELWVGNLISSLFPSAWLFAKPSDVEIFSQKISVRRIPFFSCH